jgi:uncharacterized protein
MGAAIALTKSGMDVSLFEAEPRLGGHCSGVSVSLWDGRTVRVDAGVSDFNPATFDSFCALARDLDLRYSPVNQDISFMTPERAAVWFSRGGQPQFRRRLEDERKFVDDIERFNRTCVEVLEDATYAEWSAQRYLDEKQYSDEFRRFYFDPRAHAEFSMPDKPPDQYLIRPVVSSWRMHGVVGPGAAERMAVHGGMHTYCEAVERWLRERKVSLHLSTRVAAIDRPGDVIRLRAVDRERSNLAFSFDHVIIATNAGDVTALLEDAAQEEARAYSEIPSQRARLVVHQDPALMPADRAAWGACNYLVAHDGMPSVRPTVTLYPNRLQSLSASIPDVFVTINPFREPDADKIIVNRVLVHPVIGTGTEAALQKLDALQGKRRTWFCGSYLREPFVHEQAYRCGVETAQRLVAALAAESSQLEAGISASPGGFDSFLREVPMFADLDARALAEVQLAARPFQADAGTMLFRQDDPPDGLYIIKRGEIDILRRVPGDQLIKLTTYGASAVVGEMSLLDRNRRSTHAVAVKPTSGYFVSSERFQMLRSDYRPAAFAVMDCFRREVAARTRTILDQIAERTGAAQARPTPMPRDGVAKWPAPSSPSTFAEETLASLPFFKTFRPAELREFLEPLKRYDFSRGQLVYAEGEAPRSCLLVVRGALSMNFSTPAGTSTFAVYGPGRMVGELPLVDGAPHPLACMARESTIAFEVDRIGFDLLRRGGSVVSFKFFEAVTTSIVGVLRRAGAHLARISTERSASAASTSSEPPVPT